MELQFAVKTLRDTLTFSYPIYSDYKKVLPYTDLPYGFDQKKKPWWRWYCYASGSYYSRIHVNYSLWYNNHFKKKIGVYMPIVFKMPHKREKRYKPWIKKYFIYENSYTKKIKNWINPKFFKKLNYSFNNYNYYKSNLITNYAHWKYHPILRSYKSSFYVGSENEMFISGYNSKWNNLYLRDSLYHEFLTNFNYTVPVNYFSMYNSFFLNSYDSSILLHTHSFFNYIEKKKLNRIKFIKKFSKDFFNKNNNYLFYNNIMIKYNLLFMDNYKKKLYLFYKNLRKNLFYNLYKVKLFSLFKFKNKENNFLFIKKLFSLNYKNIIIKTDLNNFNIYKKKNINNNKYLKLISINKNISKKDNNIIWFANFIKSKIYKKIKYLYYQNSYDMKNEKYFDKKNKISKSFLKLIKILKNKKFEIYKNFLSNIKKFFIYRDKIKYKKFFLIKKENFVHKLKVKRFRNYPKAFVKAKDEYRYLYDRATALTEQPSTNNLFLWSKYSESYMLNMKSFLYNFFLILIDLYKINFGYLYNLNLFNKTNKEMLDIGFSIDIQLYLFKFFSLFRKNYLKKKKNSLNYSKFLGKFIILKNYLKKLKN